jgi:hypothetical protein
MMQHSSRNDVEYGRETQFSWPATVSATDSECYRDPRLTPMRGARPAPPAATPPHPAAEHALRRPRGNGQTVARVSRLRISDAGRKALAR